MVEIRERRSKEPRVPRTARAHGRKPDKLKRGGKRLEISKLRSRSGSRSKLGINRHEARRPLNHSFSKRRVRCYAECWQEIRESSFYAR